MPDLLNKQSYHYNLPKELIAQYPLTERDQSRLMVLDRTKQTILHKRFTDIVDILVKGDVLVLNRTKVIPARLFARKENGTSIEIFLLHEIKSGVWKCLAHPGKRLKQPQQLHFSDELSGFISDSDPEGIREIAFEYEGDLQKLLDKYGHVPLPPYIERTDNSADHNNYQTVYARDNGSVAAPTAGLHFTEEILEALTVKGIIIAEIILHVGLGTFRPVKADDITQHKMHSEFCVVPAATADIINLAKQQGRRVIAVGTTGARTLESFAVDCRLTSGEQWTDIFIYPGKEFHIIDGLLTNFHLPESTLIMLVAAFAGYDFTLQAYESAVKEKYRFFSYGDAMLIL
jgi:S-adenosylmethionine:tRNA ribosyltransferase-isomerase